MAPPQKRPAAASADSAADDAPLVRATRVHGSDAEKLKQVLEPHVTSSVRYSYRENVGSGPMNTDILTKNFDLLAAALKEYPNGSVVQTAGIVAFTALAKANDEKWHLGPEIESWACSQSKRFRSMLRDLGQQILKVKKNPTRKAPNWLLPFMKATMKPEEHRA